MTIATESIPGSHPSPDAARPWFPSLDGLRCLAILPIVWHHSTPRQLDGVLGRGPLGVDLFFAVSGFLITSLLLHERRTTGRVALGRFWARRSLRIFPLYYLVLGAFVLHAVFLRAPGPARDHFLGSVPFYATYTSNWFLHGAVDHPIVFAFAWSLAAEEQFYLLWPPVLRLLRGALGPALVMSALVALDQGAERGWFASFLDEGLALRMARSFATPIGLGALLAIAAGAPTTAAPVRALLARRGSSLVALALVVAAAVLAWPLLPTHLAMAALVGACALRRDHLLAPLLENRVVRHVGVVSYGVYLLNVPIVSACRRLVGEQSSLLLFAVSTVASVAVATVTWRYVERPFLALRERLRAGARRPGDAPPHDRSGPPVDVSKAA
ncbi:MAG: acyltransferase [Labilithrix sp.]|nr:acyltransferase [Labilithrix sp.]